MKRGLVIFGLTVFLTLFIISTAIAADTLINVHTEPNAEVTIKVLSFDYKQEYEHFKKNSDSEGFVSVIFTEDQGKISVYVQVRKDGKIIDSGRFDDYITGNPVNINMNDAVETPEPVVEETPEEIPEETIPEETIEPPIEETPEVLPDPPEEQETNVASSKLTGAAISSIKSLTTSKTTYYVIGGVFVIAVFFFITLIMRKKLDKKENIKITKLSDKDKQYSDKDDSVIAEAERKIEEAKKEIEEIKNRKGRIKEAQEKLKRDQEELRRLQGDD